MYMDRISLSNREDGHILAAVDVLAVLNLGI